MAKLDARLRAYLLASLCEGVSQRACARIFGVEQRTVDKLLADAGDMAIAEFKKLKGLTIRTIQADELHSFVAAKDYTVKHHPDPPKDAGTIWSYLAMCTETKLIFAYHLGTQQVQDATTFLHKVAGKLERHQNGEFAVRPHLATDGLKAYRSAFDSAFGAYADYGMLNKSYTKVDEFGNKAPGARFAGSERKAVSGSPNESDITPATSSARISMSGWAIGASPVGPTASRRR